MGNKLADGDILHLLDIPSGSEDGFDSDADLEQNVDLYDEYQDLLEEPDEATFKVLLSQQFQTESFLDEVVEFPVIEFESDDGNYSNINIPSTNIEPTTIPNNKITRLTQQRITPILPKISKPPIVIQNIKGQKVIFHC